MVLGKKSQEVHNAFVKYVKTDDKSLIEDFTRDEVEFAKLQSSHLSKEWDYYEAMEKRIAELKEDEKEEKNYKDKWRDRVIGALFGIAITVIAGLLLHFLTK